MSVLVDTAILEWRTARRFKPEAVAVDVLEEILALAVRAPNCRMAQPWRFSVPGPCTSLELAQVGFEIMLEQSGFLAAEGTKRLLLEAPCLVGVSVQFSDSKNARRSDEDFAAVCCAIQNLTLAAHARGLAVWWRSGAVVRDERTWRVLGLEASEQLVGLLHLGYPLACVECSLEKSATTKTRWLA